MGFLDLYRIRKPEKDDPELAEEPEEELEPLPKLSLSEFWPPSPRVKLLYIGGAFAVFNAILLCIWAVVFYMRFGS